MSEPQNPYSLLKHNAETAPDAVAVGSLKRQINWLELLEEVDKIAAKLRFQGVSAKQPVLLLGENVFLWKMQLALMKLGAVPCVLTAQIIPEYLKNETLFTHKKIKTNSTNSTVVDDAWLEDARTRFKPVDLEVGYFDDDPLRLMLTSGTTGTPKAAIIPYYNFKARQSLESTNWNFGLPEFSMMGFSSAVGFWAGMRSLTSGKPYISVTDLQSNVANIVERFRVKTLIASPAQLQGESAYWTKNDLKLKTLEKIISTGSATNHKLIETLKFKTNATIYTRYGSTEAGGIAERELGDPNANEKWIGNLLHGAEVKIVGDNGVTLRAGEVGNLLVRSKSMAVGYWRNQEESKKRFKDGWFESGDLALVNENGQVILSARDTDLINMDGVKIDPDRVDLVLMKHPDVVDCGTFSLTRRNGATVAVTMAKVASPAKIEEITKFMRVNLRLGSSKLILPVDLIPRNANGKLDRTALADLYAKKVSDYMDKSDASRRV
jgi:acyl-coenzyme A synthetase/AMP-(fatty) acid ligase